MSRFALNARQRGLAMLAVAALVAIPHPAGAMPLHQAAKGYFMIGWAGLDLDDLNTDLGRHGYPRFGEDFLALGGGGHWIAGRFMIGGHGTAFLLGSEDVAVSGTNYHMGLRSGAGFLDLGFVAFQPDGWSIAPLVGIGGGGMTLDLEQRSAPTFDDVLTDPGRSSHVTQSGFLVDVGVQTDVQFVNRSAGVAYGGPVLGLRVGYTFAPYVGNWSLEGTEINGGPENGLTGWHVHLLLGFGAGRY